MEKVDNEKKNSNETENTEETLEKTENQAEKASDKAEKESVKETETKEAEKPETKEKEPKEPKEPKENKETKENKKESKHSAKYEREIEKLKNEISELNDKYIRLHAEYDNYRKRSVKEKSDAYSSAYADALKAFLPLSDSLTQALKFAADDEGIKAINSQFRNILEKLGVKEIESDGQQFDPNLHNAVMHEEDPEQGENLIVQTLQKGYTLNGKVIRPALVKVVN